MKRLTFCMVLLVGLCAAFVPAAVAQHEHPAGDPSKARQGEFPRFLRTIGSSPIHNCRGECFILFGIRKRMKPCAVAEKDPACGMAYWGIAMTYYHQVWSAPDPAELKTGTSCGKGKVGRCQDAARPGLHCSYQGILQERR